MNIATTRLEEFFIFFSGLSTASMKAGYKEPGSGENRPYYKALSVLNIK